MSIDANDAVTTGPTGPRTDDGKTRSSRNAVRYGLYTIHDFIREGEEREYAKTLTALMAELCPEGVLEQTFATQIMAAQWRLRRCGLVEFDLAESALDPMAAGPEDIQAEKVQKSVDRARAQAFSLFRRSLAELRKLQDERSDETESETNAEPTPHVTKEANSRPYPNGDRSEDQQPLVSGSFCKPAETPAETAPDVTKEAMARPYPNGDRSEDRQPLVGSSFCKPAPATPAVSSKVPRNAPCPCGSGQKYKRCCGRNGTGMPGLSQMKPASEPTPLVNAPGLNRLKLGLKVGQCSLAPKTARLIPEQAVPGLSPVVTPVDRVTHETLNATSVYAADPLAPKTAR